MAEGGPVAPYFDIPLQHAAPGMLEAMGRKVTREQVEDLIATIRGDVPGAVLRTTFLVGFPGETDEQFEDLLQFVQGMRFDRMGCFTYSAEEGTPAAEMPGQVPEEIAQGRLDRLMTAQQEIAFELARERIGEKTNVLVEDVHDEAGAFVAARGPAEAPDVDPVVLIDAEDAPESGTFVDVEIVQALGYDVIGEILGGGADDE
jgi:ribosomal protein S12 methylthiotransferase